MRVLGLIFIVLAACGISNANDAEYVPSVFGMQGLRLFPDTSNKVDLLVRNEGKPGLDFLKMPRAEYDAFEVLVAPEQLSSFKSLMEYNNIQYEVFVDDVSKVLKMQEAQQKVMRSFNAGTVSPNNRRFLRYSEMKAYMESLAETRSDIVTLFNMGKSFEGRDLIGVKFSKGGQNKPALFIDAGIHAREWMAPSTAIYIIKQLAEDPNSADIFDNVDIYVLPSLNPDGYEYTQKSFVNRMWRKTRSRSGNSRCVGVDANRNFGMMWNTVGASDDPCSDIYAGPEAFSEPEAKALRDFLESVRGTVKVYLSFHSYGQYLLHPWGFTSKLPENEPALRCAAEKAEAALAKVRGTRYQIGSSTNTLYAAAGGSDDWAMGKAGIDLAYTVELPGGRYGFAPPPSDIIPVGRETFEAVKVFAKYAEGKICQ